MREAVRVHAAPGSAYLGGGTWLNSGKAEGVTRLVSLEHLDLCRVECDRGRCVIGAQVTLQEIVESGLAPRALRDAAGLTASRTLRTMKTIGGALGLRAPDSAVIPALIALRAEVAVAGRRGPLAIESYLAAPAAHLVLSVIIPDTARPCALRSLSRTSHSPRSLVVAVSACAADAHAAAAAAVVTPSLMDPVIVVTDCVSAPVRLTTVEGACDAATIPTDIEARVGRVFAPAPDIHASPGYKRYLAGVYVADCLHDLFGTGARP